MCPRTVKIYGLRFKITVLAIQHDFILNMDTFSITQRGAVDFHEKVPDQMQWYMRDRQHFTCKSMNASRQDWHIYHLIFMSYTTV